MPTMPTEVNTSALLPIYRSVFESVAIGIEVYLGFYYYGATSQKKINPTCIDDTLHVIFGRPFHIARQNAGEAEAETSRFRMDDSFVLIRTSIYIYMTSWTVTPWTEWQECHGPLAPFFFPSPLFISFFLFCSIPLFPTFSTLIQPSDDKKDESESPAS